MDFKAVFDNQLNTSASKQIYSFPRSQRFRQNPQSINSTFYYTQKGALTDRSTKFGKQDRTPRKHDLSPAPNFYKTQSQFDLEKKKGYSFGRSQRNKLQKSISPGPGRYGLKLKETVNGYSFGREQYRNKLKTESCVVGPGDYLTPLDTLTKSKIMDTKYKNAPYGKMGTDQRFKNLCRVKTPGPGTYSSHLSIFPGTKNKTGSTFAKTARMLRDERSISPGPGYYNNFSIFAKLNKSVL